ncbi:hypothetical protein G6F46_001513 [Rhizopus delemar]|uniref:RNA exonuclease 4 n=2 Tax=Rhizopus TaxID=4842 RepID=A0A9P7CT92_9FUNG|nr:hypothetical protein G6F55_000785 [Rhizopus delemar]KAG1551799.1 hypothetical protein G6F51_001629 [Rhizopus arrhizus]KAG1504746.1 hypothetical protein G6F54_000798 [Rhizopus delemar]KAG1517590.1 hypothetical protein G6F53_001244 [Rhizopus delemar]KAG1525187.1 hypothetical protein G6F52_003549 [Rhizopus delemar]
MAKSGNKAKKSLAIAPSSNWKKLLPTIAPKNESKKRKTNEFEISPNYKGNKKRKLEELKALKKETKKEAEIPKKDDLWFGDDIEEEVLKNVYGNKTKKTISKEILVEKMNTADSKLGKFVAIDCEMVGVGPGGLDSALARVSIVNFNGAVLLDAYVKPLEKVTDYRTHVSGIQPKHLESDEAITFKEAQEKVATIIKNRILVGHAVYNDLKVLMLSHPTLLIRDTSRYKPFRKLAKGRSPGLKMLVKEVLGISIQAGSHSSVEDARFTIELYKNVKTEWEKSFGARSGLIMKKLKEKEEKSRNKKKVTVQKEATIIEEYSESEEESDSDSDSD